MTEVHLYKFPEISEQDICRLSEFVSDGRKAKIQRLKRKESRLQSLFAALLLRAVLCDRMKIDNGKLRFSVGAKGKPYLQDLPDAHFSISHTDSLVAVAISDAEIGIDAERIRPADQKLAKRFFTVDEQVFVAPETDGWLERFYLVWTRKEAYVKRSGQGLSTPLTAFSVVGGSDDFTTFKTDGYTVSVCGGGQVLTVPLDETERLLNDFIKP